MPKEHLWRAASETVKWIMQLHILFRQVIVLNAVAIETDL